MKYVLIIISFLILFQFCTSNKVKPVVDSKLNNEAIATQESWNSTITFSDSGNIKAILWSGHLRKYDDKKETLIDENLKVDFYNPQQIKTTTLTSKRGRVDETTNNLFAIDSVIVFSDSVTIRTEEMMWRNKDRKIISDKYVKVISPLETIEGYGFESDQSLKNYVIYNITYISRTDSAR